MLSNGSLKNAFTFLYVTKSYGTILDFILISLLYISLGEDSIDFMLFSETWEKVLEEAPSFESSFEWRDLTPPKSGELLLS